LEQTDAWVVIRAIESTFYQVTTSDDMVSAKITSAYKDVRVASGPVASTPFPQVPREGDRSVAPNNEPVDMTGTFGDTQIKIPLKST
jgi:hypothetical protein